MNLNYCINLVFRKSSEELTSPEGNRQLQRFSFSRQERNHSRVPVNSSKVDVLPGRHESAARTEKVSDAQVTIQRKDDNQSGEHDGMAMTSVENQFVFVQALPLGRSRKEQELERAKARSHAAKAVHLRIDSKDRPPQSPVLAVAKTNTFARKVLRQQHKTPQLIPSYLSLLRGNSDPFGASAIPITPRVNALMTHNRETYLVAFRRDMRAEDQSTEWRQIVGLLNDECTAYALLACTAAAMAPIGHQRSNPELSMEALVYKSKGFRLLRNRIKRGEVDERTVSAVLCLISAEIFERNVAAASVHVSALARMFRGHDTSVDVDLLQGFFPHNAHEVIAPLLRPAFDANTWIPDQSRPHLKALPMSTRLEGVATASFFDGATFRDIISIIRQCLRLSLFAPIARERFGIDLGHFLRNGFAVLIGRLINGFLDATAECMCRSAQGQSPEESSIFIRAQVQAYTSLATLLYLRTLACPERYGIFKTVAPLVDQLKQALDASEWMEHDMTQREYAYLRLWALYIGAQWEQSEAARNPNPDHSPSREWANAKFAVCASALGIKSWAEMRIHLSEILYTDVPKPDGSTWFMETIVANVS